MRMSLLHKSSGRGKARPSRQEGHVSSRPSHGMGETARDERRRGAVLAAVLIVMLVLALLGVGLLNLSSVDALEAGRNISAAQAFWAAEAGTEHVKAIGQKNRKPFTSIPYGAGFLRGSNVLTGITSKGTYTVDVLDDPAWTNANQALKKYVIRSVGVSTGGARQVVILRTMIQNYASYMHASHSEAGVSFGTGSTIDGPVYTDDQLHISGPVGPEFLQSVKSGASSIDYSWRPVLAAQVRFIFKGDLQLNAPPLDIIGQFSSDHITDIRSQAQVGGLDLSGVYSLTFSQSGVPGSGTVVYSNMTTGVTDSRSLALLNGAIYVSSNAYVRGVVDGNVTVAANGLIYITTNITYASASGLNDPWASNTFNNAAVDDKLGLISRTGVLVQGTNTIAIHASIMVTEGVTGFGAESRNVVFGVDKYIKAFGGITQYSRGVVANAGSPFRGFKKNYKFDSRFLTDAPPNFPYSVYVYSGWSQSSGP